jgi:hypothetical protein
MAQNPLVRWKHRYLRTRKVVVTKQRYGQSVGKWSGDIWTGSGDLGVRGIGWLQIFGGLDI